MAISLPNGATVFLASGYGSALPVTVLTNASPPVATSAGHGLSNGDIVEVTSNWSRINNKIVRVASVATDTFALEGMNSTDTDIYAPGGGLGSVRKITGFTQLQQIIGSATSGGAQQFATYQLLEADSQNQIPTVKNPYEMTFDVADDPSLAGFIAAGVANDDRLPRAWKLTMANGGFIYYNAYTFVNRIPSMTVNTVMTCQVGLNMLAEPTRYAS